MQKDTNFSEHLNKRGALDPNDPVQRAHIDEMLGMDSAMGGSYQAMDPIKRMEYFLGRPVRITMANGTHLSGWVKEIDETFITMNTAPNPLKGEMRAIVLTGSIESIEEMGVTTKDPREHDQEQADRLVKQLEEQAIGNGEFQR